MYFCCWLVLGICFKALDRSAAGSQGPSLSLIPSLPQRLPSPLHSHRRPLPPAGTVARSADLSLPSLTEPGPGVAGEGALAAGTPSREQGAPVGEKDRACTSSAHAVLWEPRIDPPSSMKFRPS